MAAPLPDGIDPIELSARFTKMQRDINPYLTDSKSDKGMVQWMFDQMPPAATPFVVEAVPSGCGPEH